MLILSTVVAAVGKVVSKVLNKVADIVESIGNTIGGMAADRPSDPDAISGGSKPAGEKGGSGKDTVEILPYAEGSDKAKGMVRKAAADARESLPARSRRVEAAMKEPERGPRTIGGRGSRTL